MVWKSTIQWRAPYNTERPLVQKNLQIKAHVCLRWRSRSSNPGKLGQLWRSRHTLCVLTFRVQILCWWVQVWVTECVCMCAGRLVTWSWLSDWWSVSMSWRTDWPSTCVGGAQVATSTSSVIYLLCSAPAPAPHSFSLPRPQERPLHHPPDGRQVWWWRGWWCIMMTWFCLYSETFFYFLFYFIIHEAVK